MAYYGLGFGSWESSSLPLTVMAKSKKSLKATLNSHQVRMLKNKQVKALESQRVSVKKAQAQPKARPVIPYTPSDTILLVGEGLFPGASTKA